MRPVPNELTEQQLREYLKLLIKSILKEMKGDMSENQINKMVDDITLSLKAGMKEGTFNVKDLQDPNFIKKMVVACVVGVTAENLNNNPAIAKLRKEKGGDVDSNNPTAKLTKEEIATIALAVEAAMSKVMQEMQKDYLITMTPKPPQPGQNTAEDKDEDKKAEEWEAFMVKLQSLKAEIEKYFYLYSINPAMAGSNPVIVSYSEGNKLGIPDPSPGVGEDAISQTTKLINQFSGEMNINVAISLLAVGDVVEPQGITKATESAYANPPPSLKMEG